MPPKKQPEKKESDSKNSSVTDGLLEMLNPNKMLDNAQRVISSAVNVLEEEIAAGILAAKNIERKVLDFDVADSNPENLMNRIRRDTHEALDIFLDAFASLSKQVGMMSETLNKANDKQGAMNDDIKKETASIQLIEHDEFVKAGEIISLYLSLNDDSITSPSSLQVEITDFVAGPKQKITNKFIKLSPTDIILKPKEEVELCIQIAIPKSATPAKYRSLLTIFELPDISIVLSFEVK